MDIIVFSMSAFREPLRAAVDLVVATPITTYPVPPLFWPLTVLLLMRMPVPRRSPSRCHLPLSRYLNRQPGSTDPARGERLLDPHPGDLLGMGTVLIQIGRDTCAANTAGMVSGRRRVSVDG